MQRLVATRTVLRALGWRLVAAVLLACVVTGPASLVQANGTPIRIVLSYLNGVSSFGPRNATGVAELITSEGEVRLQAAGLQKLGDDEQYELWISSTTANERMPLGPDGAPLAPFGFMKVTIPGKTGSTGGQAYIANQLNNPGGNTLGCTHDARSKNVIRPNRPADRPRVRAGRLPTASTQKRDHAARFQVVVLAA